MIGETQELSPKQLKHARAAANSITRIRALDMLLWSSGINIYDYAFRSGNGT